jgi:hypothetical protein
MMIVEEERESRGSARRLYDLLLKLVLSLRCYKNLTHVEKDSGPLLLKMTAEPSP